MMTIKPTADPVKRARQAGYAEAQREAAAIAVACQAAGKPELAATFIVAGISRIEVMKALNGIDASDVPSVGASDVSARPAAAGRLGASLMPADGWDRAFAAARSASGNRSIDLSQQPERGSTAAAPNGWDAAFARARSGVRP
jgi:hypothetical protein